MFCRYTGTSGRTWPTLGITVEPGDVVEIADEHAAALNAREWEVLEGDREVLGSGITVDTLIPTGRAPGEPETVMVVRVLPDGADAGSVVRVVMPPTEDGESPRQYQFDSADPVPVHTDDVAELIASGAFALLDDGGEPLLYGGLTKAQLQDLLTERGLATSGTKDELIERLSDDDVATVAGDDAVDGGYVGDEPAGS